MLYYMYSKGKGVCFMNAQEKQVMAGHIESMLEAMENDIKNTKERDVEIPDYDIECLLVNRNIFEDMKENGCTVHEFHFLFDDVKMLHESWEFNA